MTINNPEKFCSGLWDWGILNGCFGATRIKPTDIDGFVERNGKFLILEAKSPGAEIPTGQMITFKRLIDTGYFTVIIVWGNTNNPERLTVMTSRTTREIDQADLERLRSIVSNWFEFANSTPVFSFSE